MKKTVLFLLLASTSMFVSAQTVYAFLYDYTDNDGVKTKNANQSVAFVAKSGNMIGVSHCYSVGTAYSEWDAYAQMAIDDLNRRVATKDNGPTHGVSSYCLLLENSEFSTSNKTTYRGYGAGTVTNYVNGMIYRSWGDPSWEPACYTIKNDYSEFIEWRTSGTTHGVTPFYTPPQNQRQYYKGITRSDLRPNTDFLYE